MKQIALMGLMAACIFSSGCDSRIIPVTPILTGNLLSDSSCGTMIEVPAGPFGMGCDKMAGQCGMEDVPHHSVTVPAYLIDRCDVTAADYAKCVDAGTCSATEQGAYCTLGVPGWENHPMTCVDWGQARTYCQWADKRLPTEAEWEKAARGTDGRKYPWGNEPLDCDHAVQKATGCGPVEIAPVGNKPKGASPYGALDMAGNVWQWVEDDYHGDYEGAPSDGSAWIENPRRDTRIIRGGSIADESPERFATSYRHGVFATNDAANFGFRCALSVP